MIQGEITRLAQREQPVVGRLLAVWEGAVRETHVFLEEQDIQNLAPLVRGALEQIETLYVYRDGEGREQAFLGVEGDKLEMLFVDPALRGGGIGGRLVRFAIKTLGVRRVDVNEQNPQAVGFYEHMGFRSVSRSALDGQGNPYPLLHMELPPV